MRVAAVWKRFKAWNEDKSGHWAWMLDGDSPTKVDAIFSVLLCLWFTTGAVMFAWGIVAALWSWIK